MKDVIPAVVCLTVWGISAYAMIIIVEHGIDIFGYIVGIGGVIGGMFITREVARFQNRNDK